MSLLWSSAIGRGCLNRNFLHSTASSTPCYHEDLPAQSAPPPVERFDPIFTHRHFTPVVLPPTAEVENSLSLLLNSATTSLAISLRPHLNDVKLHPRRLLTGACFPRGSGINCRAFLQIFFNALLCLTLLRALPTLRLRARLE